MFKFFDIRLLFFRLSSSSFWGSLLKQSNLNGIIGSFLLLLPLLGESVQILLEFDVTTYNDIICSVVVFICCLTQLCSPCSWPLAVVGKLIPVPETPLFKYFTRRFHRRKKSPEVRMRDASLYSPFPGDYGRIIMF